MSSRIEVLKDLVVTIEGYHDSLVIREVTRTMQLELTALRSEFLEQAAQIREAQSRQTVYAEVANKLLDRICSMADKDY